MTRLDEQIAVLAERLREAEVTRRRGYGAGLTDEGRAKLAGELGILTSARRAAAPEFGRDDEVDTYRDLHDVIDPDTATVTVMSANGVVSVDVTAEQLTRFFQYLSDDARTTVNA